MNNKIAFGIGGIVLGLLLAAIFAFMFFPAFRNGGIGMMNSNTHAEGNPQMMGTINSTFIEQMIPHHESAVAMAKLALEKSKRTEIKTLATAIIADQTKEIKDMTGWYKDWFGREVPKGGAQMHMGGQDDMTSLEKATDFDKAFLEEMTAHHRLALMMVTMLTVENSRPELLQLAKNITASQSAQIQQMQTWYSTWYK